MEDRSTEEWNFRDSLIFLVFLAFLILCFVYALHAQMLVSLEWDPNSELDLAGYNMYRSETQGSGYQKLNTETITSTTFEDTTAQIGIRYYYVVTALDTTTLESGFSNEVNFARCLGDSNNDDQVNVLDSLLILNHILGNITLSGNDFEVADVNRDGNVDVLDDLAIQNHILGNIPLPDCP